jgi:WD40 repeat protein
MWRLPSFEKRGIIATRAGHADVVRCLAKGPGNSFFSGSMDKLIMVWEFMQSVA